MRKFIFPLGKVRDYKIQLLDKEKNVLAGLNLEKNAHLVKLDDLKAEYLSIDDEMRIAYRGGTSIMKIKVFVYRKDCIKQEEEQIKERLRILEKAIEKQRKAVIKISQEVESYNKLEERAKEEYNEELKRETENTIGEFISTKLGAALSLGEAHGEA